MNISSKGVRPFSAVQGSLSLFLSLFATATILTGAGSVNENVNLYIEAWRDRLLPKPEIPAPDISAVAALSAIYFIADGLNHINHKKVKGGEL